ncbi:glycosyltransferase [Paraburkholderia sp. MMS20-SJTR3]|uniref:Glycosyltransferase n=1 Tax=Paraburkholderia sejongensis TaxID=2886946 RepID=A0ABS8K1E6_9BURK|nr:glycosyltransferase family 2 protein [Paraburkholderia sp. MMS20-SJTR3]MCC8395986.1 glycosyltransferase [Paraburkholderia sp. MMS20-SJTR3]
MSSQGENLVSAEPQEGCDHNEQATIRTTVAIAAPSVTVVMANFNGANWIEEAIQSVQRQSVADWELIVVDDASTDASVEIVQAAAARDPRIVLLTSATNAGPSIARNRALDRARGRWITILDSDDRFAPGRLEALLAKAEATGAGIVADDLLIMNESGSLTGYSLLGLTAEKTFDAVALVNAPNLGYLQPMIKTELLTGLRYDARVRSAEDFDLLLRVLVERDAQMLVYPALGYHYRRRGDSLSTDKAADRRALLGMLDANARFRASYALSGRLADACEHRQRTLETSLRWVDVTEAVREKRFSAAIRHTLDHPRVLSCAAQFVAKRFRVHVLGNKRRAQTLGL